MPYMPIDGVMTFNDDQAHQVDWYASWSDTLGYAVWHHVSDDDRVSTFRVSQSILYSPFNPVVFLCKWLCAPVPPIGFERRVFARLLRHSRAVSKQSRRVEVAPPHDRNRGQSSRYSLLRIGFSKSDSFDPHYLLFIFSSIISILPLSTRTSVCTETG